MIHFWGDTALEPIKLALCGCLGHVEKFGRMINSYEESQVIAVWDRLPERGKVVASHLGCAFEPDYDRLVADDALDGVLIVAENVLHKELVIKAAQHGKHVFVEKPLCVDPKEAREIQAVIHQTGVTFFMSDPFVRSAAVYLKKLIALGTLGDITGARIRLGTAVALGTEKEPHLYNRAFSQGGIMADIGGHTIHIAHYLFGKPTQVSAVLSAYSDTAKENKIEENAIVVMQYPDDKLVTLECSWASGGETNVTEVYGTKGWARITKYGTEPGEEMLTYQLGAEPSISLFGDALPPRPKPHVRYFVEMIANDLPNNIVGVDDLSNSGVSIDHAVEFVDIIDAIYRSANSGAVAL